MSSSFQLAAFNLYHAPSDEFAPCCPRQACHVIGDGVDAIQTYFEVSSRLFDRRNEMEEDLVEENDGVFWLGEV